MAPVAIHQTAFTSSKFQPPFKSHSDTSTVHKPMRDSSPVHRARGDSSPVHKPKKDSSLFQHGRPPPVAVSAHGLIIHLEDGRDVLDGCGGAAVACLGSGNREIIDAMCSQANTLSFAYHQVVGNPAAEELAAWLCDRSEGAFVGAAFLNSGSEAMEAAIKLCRQYWVEKGQPQRKYIVARFPSYHGNTLGALAVGNVPPRRDMYKVFFGDFIHHVSSPTYRRSHRSEESEDEYSLRLARELDDKITELGPENIMAFIAEPVVGAALGVMPPPTGYFAAIDEVVKKHDILLVMDEVMSGTGRVGDLFAHQAIGTVQPDICTIAKGLGAGHVTISSILVAAKVHQVVSGAGMWKNSHTYQNHPVNCAVALKALQIMERDNLFLNVRERGAQMMLELRRGLRDVEGVLDIRGKGLFIGIEFGTPASMTPRFATRIKGRCLANGLLTLGFSGTIDGHEGEVLCLAPAYIVTEAQISTMVEIVVRSVKECLAQVSGGVCAAR